jgi:hypothetical protein
MPGNGPMAKPDNMGRSSLWFGHFFPLLTISSISEKTLGTELRFLNVNKSNMLSHIR